jgi:hypothetical protein
MYDMPLSDGCVRLGVIYMADSVRRKMHNEINNKAEEILFNAKEEFDKYLRDNGYEWWMGVIRSKNHPACFGKPLCYHNRAENDCYDCPFENGCDAARKENNT